MGILEQYPALLDDEYVEHFDFETCYTVLNPEGPYDPHDVAVALLRSYGNISKAAKTLRRGRRSLETHIIRTLELREFQEDIEQSFIDDIEEAYKNDARLGDTGARRFFLTTKAKDRGYSTRSELTGKDGDPMEMEISNAREILADRVSRLIDRIRTAPDAELVDASRGGSAPLGLENMGEARAASSD